MMALLFFQMMRICLLLNNFFQMNSRRTFIKQSTSLLALSTIPNFACMKSTLGLKNIGIQLFSLPKLLETDFLSAIKILKRMGYSQLELYGPYTFSVNSVKESWKALEPALGFNGSGYFNKSRKEVKQILADHNMTTPSMHTDLDTLIEEMGALAEAAHDLGQKYVVLPAIPPEKRTTLDDYKRIADIFNQIGAYAKREGIKFAYHNHGYGIKPLSDGTVPLDLLIDRTDPDLVFLELDIYWTTAGGADPVDYLKKYPNRYHLMHLKDMKPITEFEGDGGDPSQWMALFPYMTNVGDGELDIVNIIETAKSTGVKYFFVEQDMVAQPEIALKRSIDFLKK